MRCYFYAFFRLSFNISLYSSACFSIAGFKNGYAGDFRVPNSTSLCYRSGFLSSTSYTLPLCKFGVHFHPFRMSNTLGGIFALLTLNLYALRWRVMFSLTSVLSIKQFVYAYKFVSMVSCIYFFVI